MSRVEKRKSGLASLGATAALLALIALAASRAFPVLDHEQEKPGGVVLDVRDVCREIWLSDGWDRSATSTEILGRLYTHDDMKAYLDRIGKKDLWYVIILEENRLGAGPSLRKAARRPYDQPEYLAEFRGVLSAIWKEQPNDPPIDFRQAVVKPMPDAYRGLDPAEAHLKLQEDATIVPNPRASQP